MSEKEEKRTGRCFVWVNPCDCEPPHGLDLTEGSRDSIKVNHLEAQFRVVGFGEDFPALVGYVLDGKIQLLSGTHRHEAARRAGVMLPVTLWLRSDVEGAWGVPEEWAKLIADVPLKELYMWPLTNDPSPFGVGNRVEPSCLPV
jgi:hypothetical protein